MVNNELSHAAGFKINMTYNDGYGQARKPRTGEMYYEQNTTAIMPIEHIGFQDEFSFETTDRYELFIRSASTNIDINKCMDDLYEQDKLYRKALSEHFQADRSILSNAFW